MISVRLFMGDIDDLFLLFKHPDDAKLFLNYLNCQHQNIKFTCETELELISGYPHNSLQQ